MPTYYQSLPVSAQAAYSELFEALRMATLRRSVADLSGSFAAKTVKGRRYWYFAFRDAVDGRVRQIYIGPDTPELQTLIEAKSRSTPTQVQLRGQVAAALALGCAPILGSHFRIVRQLEQAGLFRAGGVLVGSHAFGVYGNMLGARWGQSAQTFDVDFAIGRPGDPISLAVPDVLPVDVPSAIDSLAMGFVPHAALGGSTYDSPKDVGLRIDFLTPAGRETRSEYVEALKIPLQPLKFLEYLIEAPVQAALLEPHGQSVLINVPDPARYAVHKLIVSQERAARERDKAGKDLMQAACLFDYHLDTAPFALVAAHDDAVGRGKGWQQRVNAGLRGMFSRAPDLAPRWKSVLDDE